MATSYKTKFCMALMNLYRNAPMSTDISLTVDFTKGTVLVDDLDSRSSDATSHLGTTPPSSMASSKTNSLRPRAPSSKSSKRRTLASGEKKATTTDDELDWNEPLEGIVLPDGDYPTFSEIELAARRIQAAARKKNISVEKEIAYRNNQPKKAASSARLNSLRRRLDILRNPTTSQSALYPMDPDSKKEKKSKKSRRSRPKSGKKTKKKRSKSPDSLSRDVRLTNSQCDSPTSFDIDSTSTPTDEIFP